LIGHQRERKLLGTRNGLNVFSTLKTKTRLKAKTPMKQVTEKQRKLNQSWRALTDIRYEQTNHLCEWCGTWGNREHEHILYLNGHHIERRAKGNYILSNLYVAHQYQCHQFITDNNVDCHEFQNANEWNLAHPEKLFRLK